MAISLNDHEDRLQSIERRDWYSILDHTNIQIPQDSNFVEICRYDPADVKMIFIYFSYAYSNTIMTVLPAGNEYYSCKIWPISDKTYEGSTESIYVEINVGTISMKTFGPSINDNCVIAIYGFGDRNKLKLYYNFSYNIYSLANSISFHFLKCLIKIRN